MDELTIWSIAGIIAGVLWFLYGFKRLRLRRRILGLATSKIRSLAMGTIELSGRVRIESPIVDPIFSRPCAYFNIVVKERRGSGKHRRWVTLYRNDSSGTPFLIEDSTGVARIVPIKAELQFPPEVNQNGSALFQTKDDAVARFLSSVGAGSFNSRMITAYILREGQPLFAVGYAKPMESAGLAVAPQSRDAARLLKSDPAAMKSADANGDGVVDTGEWDAAVARKAGELEARERAQKLAEAPPVDALVTVSRCPDGLFILANTEENLLSKLNFSAWLGLIGGPAVAIASIAYLAIKYKHI